MEERHGNLHALTIITHEQQFTAAVRALIGGNSERRRDDTVLVCARPGRVLPRACGTHDRTATEDAHMQVAGRKVATRNASSITIRARRGVLSRVRVVQDRATLATDELMGVH